MSTSRYVGRHGSRRPSPLSRLGALPSSAGAHGARAAAKTVAGVGIVLGSGAFVIAPTSAVGSQSGTDVAAVESVDTTAAELLGERAGDPTASRSASRTTAAITAPTGSTADDAHEDSGALGINPVVKPRPKPKPVEQEQTDEADSGAEREQTQTSRSSDTRNAAKQEAESSQSSQSQSSVSEQSSGSVATGNYASQGAALGLGPNAQKVYSAVRTQFPDMTNIGGYRAGDPGDHGSGNAVDIMVTGSRGDQVASWLQANAGQLNIKYIIWKQRIWMPGGSWKPMEDRGDPTQNHFDHVHVSVG